MMKFLQKFPNQLSILRVSLYSTQIEPNYASSLFWRLHRCNEQRVSAIPVLDEWVNQGGTIHYSELTHFIKSFRRNNRFKPALEIAEWMNRSSNKRFAVNPGQIAIQLDLISKVRGVEQAENFFNSLEDGFKDVRVYSALLNCYANAKSLEKAEATFEKLRKLNVHSIAPYNMMMSLYSQMGMHGKLDPLMQEVERKGIDYSAVTYNIRLNAYADSDLDGMEKLLMKMEVDPMASADYYTYAIAAKGYNRAGALEKALSALKKAEHLIRGGNLTRSAYGGLISLYASMHRREDVHRLWSVLQNSGRVYYGSYVYVLNALEKLDDLDGAKKIVEELVEKNKSFDIRIPNLVIGAYCKKGEVEEAELILKKIVEKGKEPCGMTWGHMALGYYNSGRMEKAVEMTKKALSSTYPFWKPNLTLIAACLEYLKKKGDEEETQELLESLEKCGSFSAEFRERIGRYLSN